MRTRKTKAAPAPKAPAPSIIVIRVSHPDADKPGLLNMHYETYGPLRDRSETVARVLAWVAQHMVAPPDASETATAESAETADVDAK